MSQLFDFGMNTYQYVITFKIDCLSPSQIAMYAQTLVLRKVFTNVTKDENGLALMVSGDGTKEAPLFQVRIGPASIALWTGWWVEYRAVREWQAERLSDFGGLLKTAPLSLVQSLSSQSSILIPVDMFKDASVVPEFQPIRGLLEGFMPSEILKGSARGFLAFTSPGGRESIEWWLGGSTVPNTENVAVQFTRHALDPKLDLEKNVLSHLARADELRERFHSGFLARLLKQ